MFSKLRDYQVETVNYYEWIATCQGPVGTPYEGLPLRIQINLPQNYPWKCPRFKFLTKMHHPLVGMDGTICNEIFDDMGEWSAARTLTKEIFYILYALGEIKGERSVQNQNAAETYLDAYDLWFQQARNIASGQ